MSQLYSELSATSAFIVPSDEQAMEYTLPFLLERASQIHGDKYDYSMITTGHVIGATSKVPIICNMCQCRWETKIGDHFNTQRGCPSCALKASS